LHLLGEGFGSREPVTNSDSSQNQRFRQSRFFLESDQSPGQPPEHPQDQLVQREPEFADVPEHLRGQLFVAKVRAKNFAGIFKGVGLGMLVTLVTALPLALSGAAFAGFAVQRCGSVRAAIPLYLEMYAILSLVIVAMVVVILSVSIGWLTHTVQLAFWLLLVLLIVFAVLAILGRWQQRDRWIAYWLGFGAVSIPSLLQEGWESKGLLILLAFTPAFVLLAWQRVRGKPMEVAPLTAAPPTDQTRSFTGHPDE